MPRTPIIVTLEDGKDHLIIDGEVTGCGQVVPPVTPWQESTSNPCPVCYPEDEKPKKAAKSGKS